MNEKRPKISVIVPVYNTEKYLHQCLDTIINQTLKEIEIICVDDGSTDNSLQIIMDYQKKDERIIILNQNNGGGGKARNTGIEISTGEYLTFLDSDDYFDLQFLEKMYNQAISDKADLVVCMAKKFNIQTNKLSPPFGIVIDHLPKMMPFSHSEMKTKYIFSTFHNVPWNKLFRRDMIIIKGLRFQEIYHTNDAYFSQLSVINANIITLVKEPLIYYRTGTNTNTQSHTSEYPLNFNLALSAIREKLIESNQFHILEQGFVNYALEICIMQEGKYKEFTSKKLVYDYIVNTLFEEYGINNHDIKYYSNKLNYYKYTKMKNLSCSEYTNKNIIVKIHFLLSHPIVGLITILYLETLFIRLTVRGELKSALTNTCSVLNFR